MRSPVPSSKPNCRAALVSPWRNSVCGICRRAWGRVRRSQPMSWRAAATASTRRAVHRTVSGKGWNSPDTSQAPVAVVSPPATRPAANSVRTNPCLLDARQTGEASTYALLRLQTEPDSEYPASPAKVAHARTSLEATWATTRHVARRSVGAAGSVRRLRARWRRPRPRSSPASSLCICGGHLNLQ